MAFLCLFTTVYQESAPGTLGREKPCDVSDLALTKKSRQERLLKQRRGRELTQNRNKERESGKQCLCIQGNSEKGLKGIFWVKYKLSSIDSICASR